MFKIFQKSKKAASQPASLSGMINESAIKIEQIMPEPRRWVVNGKLYDTSKAERAIDSFYTDNGTADVIGIRADFPAILFASPHKNFFVQQFGKLYAISDDIAKILLAAYPDQYVKYFGEVEEA